MTNDKDKLTYLRKVGRPINGRIPYVAIDLTTNQQTFVWASDRDMAKTKVWKVKPKYKFWR